MPRTRIGYTAIGPVDVTATPTIISPFFPGGTAPIRNVLSASGSVSKGNVFGFTTAAPHGLTTGVMIQQYTGFGQYKLTNGETASPFPRQVYVTGPTTFFMVWASGGDPGILPQTYTLDPSQQYSDNRYPQWGGIPHETQAILTGKFMNANLHVNVWTDATDATVTEIARRVLANFPAGRTVWVEYANEPWNWYFSPFYYLTSVIGPNVVIPPPFLNYWYLDRSVQVHNIFRTVFATAGRANEVKGLLNCQMGSGDSSDYLKRAAAQGWQIDAIALAPYWDLTPNEANCAAFNLLDDEQALDMDVHDLWYGPRRLSLRVKSHTDAIAAYNASGGHCVLIGYEGGIAHAEPYDNGLKTQVVARDQRNHDLIYHPGWYTVEQDWYLLCQQLGFTSLNVYSLSQYWNPEGWGMYHWPGQKRGRGDGSDGKQDNRLVKANPTSPQYKGPNVNQDLMCVSVRGQAYRDWNAAVKAAARQVRKKAG
jgi:hypothetical protein